MSGQVDRVALHHQVQRLVRLLGVESQRVGHTFAQLSGLHPTDLDALVHVMDAEQRGTPLTPGRLGAILGLSSGATTALVDRLAAGGHVVRDRDPDDRRRVLLRHADHGREVAMAYFGPLGGLSEEVMSGFSETELDAVRRFLAGMTEAIAVHRRSLDTPDAQV